MLPIHQLRAEHDVLLALADEMERAASGLEPTCLPTFVILWERFNQLLGIHLLREDGILYPTILEHGDLEAAGVASAFQKELGDLEARADAFAGKWTEAAVGSCWHAFSNELHTFLGEVRTRIHRENDELYPLLGRAADPAVMPFSEHECSGVPAIR